MLLSCQKLNKGFGGKDVLTDVRFQMEAGEKAAVIGVNGAGKTTLFHLITGEDEPDDGAVVIAGGTRIGYLAQYQSPAPGNSVYEEILDSRADILQMETQMRAYEEAISRAGEDELSSLYQKYNALTERYEMENGFALRSEAVGILKGLGFTEEEFSSACLHLSGGQKTRLALGRLLLEKPDLLILDEPTNHLDIAGIAFLESFLRSYKKAVLFTSHDRYFVNALASKIIEIEHGRSQVYTGGYQAYEAKKAEMRYARQRAYLKQQDEIRHQEQVIEKLRSFNREKSIRRAESREKKLARMELIERPEEMNDTMRLVLTPETQSGNDVLYVEGLAKAFPQKELFRDLTFTLFRGERMAVIGENGCGKSTLLKVLLGMMPANAGTVRKGANVSIGYYDQEIQFANEERTLFDEISDAYPHLTGTRIRNLLAAYLFTGDDVFQQIGSLSGGERGRLSLAKLMLSKANVLFLDEPTNHLDLASKEVLEDVLVSYPGTVLFVSHDRYFINKTATRILEMEGGICRLYDGNYDAYLAEKARLAQTVNAGETHAAAASGGEKEERLKRKAEETQRRRIANEIRRLEDLISEKEQRIEEIDLAMADPANATDHEQLMLLAGEREELHRSVEEALSQWEELQAD